MNYKTTDGLMRHLRENGLAISGGTQKRQLINTGYFHGYKGYRFFRHAGNRLPFTSYSEVYATIRYDSALKALMYGKVMFIETAVKNIAIEAILTHARSESIQAMCDRVVSSYHNAPMDANEEKRRRLQQAKLNLQNSIQASLAKEYRRGNPKITHFYDNPSYAEVPVWALFEILTMGDFGFLLSCLTYDVRDDISRRIGFNLACDTDRQLIYKYIYMLKDLRNAIAHNAVVFDTRFRSVDPNRTVRQCLKLEIGLPYVNFKTIGDYVILVCYYLKCLHEPKMEIKAFLRAFEKITTDYVKAVSPSVASIVIHHDLSARMATLYQYI